MAFAGAILLAASCGKSLVEVQVDVVDQRTALENQVLGSYKEIDRDLMMLASVRSIDESGRLKEVDPLPKERMKVIRALQRSKFNQDDIDYFKELGSAGENKEGFLTFFESEPTRLDEEYHRFVTAIIEQENEDRKTIMNRILETNENFTENDLPKVQTIFANLNRDSAPEGVMIQLDDGQWVRKTAKNE
jgi:uncharacterized protein YprB with RNaseH-like and TPR domain